MDHWRQFAVLTILTFTFFLVYGYMQEWIFRQEGMKLHGWYLTLVQFCFYAVAAKIEMWFFGGRRAIPFYVYLFLALAQLVTIGFSNASLGYLNYPTQVVFKCCKLVPVLVGGIVIQGKRYGCIDFSAASLMTLGLIWFTLSDSKVSPEFHPQGVAMISIALVADAVIGNMQERVMKRNEASNVEVILYSYFVGFAYLLVTLFLTGHLWAGFEYFASNPSTKYGSAFIFSLSGYLGMRIILSFVRTFGAFATVTVTSFRKVLTIVLSFLLFEKPFTMQYLYSGMLIIFAIFLNQYGKMIHKRPAPSKSDSLAV